MNNTHEFKSAVSKLERFCDYQERCSFDVEKKLRDIECPVEITDDVVDYLIEHKFLDDSRYAKSFVNGKFSYKRWGKRKIYAALRAKRISSTIIYDQLNQIDEDEYYETLEYICEVKLRNIGDLNSDVNKKKLMNFALQRGFESSIIWKFINEKQKY